MADCELKLSIIVPVYNVEKYLSQCLDSLINQNIPSKEYEIIIVDDGSTDSSSFICDEYANNHSNICVIHQKNQSLSVARNNGLKQAKGEYIYFVDSDDYIENNIISQLYKIAKDNDIDILFFDYYKEYLNGKSVSNNSFSNIKRNEIYSGYDFFLKINEFGAVWKSFYKRDLILSSNILFIPKITRQDCDFNLRLFPLAKKIMDCGLFVYHYRILEETLSHTKSIEKLRFNLSCDFAVAASALHYSEVQDFASDIKKKYKKHINSMVVSCLIDLYLKRNFYGKGFYDEIINYCYDNSILPIVGQSNSWKTTLMIPFINFLFRNNSVEHKSERSIK